MAMVVLRGCPYETEGISRLNINADTLNDYFINLGKKEGSNLSIHTYQGRHKVLKEFDYSFDNEIVAETVPACFWQAPDTLSSVIRQTQDLNISGQDKMHKQIPFSHQF